MKISKESLVAIIQSMVILSIIGSCLIIYYGNASRAQQADLLAQLTELRRGPNASYPGEFETHLDVAPPQCASTKEVVSYLAARSKAGASPINSVQASVDHEKYTIVVNALGTYTMLKDETIIHVTDLPCTSLDAVELHRDRANDMQLVAEFKMSLF